MKEPFHAVEIDDNLGRHQGSERKQKWQGSVLNFSRQTNGLKGTLAGSFAFVTSWFWSDVTRLVRLSAMRTSFATSTRPDIQRNRALV
jgi:hypothetical protein